MDLSAVATGTGETRVVLVHGVLDSGRSFARVSEILAGQCQLITYDRRGYGSSVNAAGPPVGIDEHIDDLVAILDNRPAVVVGHSFGGVVAAGAAVRAPDLVRSLVLYETIMAWLPGWDDRNMRELLWSQDPEDAGLRLMLGERYVAMNAEQQQRRRVQARSFVAEERSVRGDRPPYSIADLQLPVVYGFSAGFPYSAMQEHWRTVVADVDLVPIVGGDHHAHRTAPEAFADLVRRGIQRAR
jgi:pimeloyl-ACP methyl ester carboxylesterase